MDDRFVELETKILFQEDAIQKLNNAVNLQERQIFRLTKELEGIQSKIASLAPSLLLNQQDEAPPPHY